MSRTGHVSKPPTVQPPKPGFLDDSKTRSKTESKPTFTLFRFPNAANQAAGIGEFVGSLVINDHCYAIDAEVAEYTKPDGSPGKYFRGRVMGGQAVLRSMMRGSSSEIPEDLVTLMEPPPFDDPLPHFTEDAK